MDTRTLILKQLDSVAASKNIEILYVCESGSRAWGFPSPDSDFDVRFIYRQPLRRYLTVAEQPDQIGMPINDDLDIYGWDVRKVLRLVGTSNCTPFEWLQSPIVYYETPGFRTGLWQAMQHYFCARRHIHHYLGVARSALESMDDEGTIKIKKLFYVLRPLLAAQWCLDRQQIAPMNIQPLMDALTADIRRSIKALIEQKEHAPEGWQILPPPSLMSFIDDAYRRLSSAVGQLEKKQFDLPPLDDYFYSLINGYDDTGVTR